MWDLLRQVEVVNFIVLEVALAVLLWVSTELIGKWEQTGALAHGIWKALLIWDIHVEQTIWLIVEQTVQALLLLIDESEEAWVVHIVGIKALADWVSFHVGTFALKCYAFLTIIFRLLLGWACSTINGLLGVIGWLVILLRVWCHFAHLVVQWLEAEVLLSLAGNKLVYVVQTKTFIIRWILQDLVLFFVVETNIDILVKILGQLEHLLDSTFFKVVVDVISLILLLLFGVHRLGS